MKLMSLTVALLAFGLPMGLLVLHPSTRASLEWDGGGMHRSMIHAAPQHLASR